MTALIVSQILLWIMLALVVVGLLALSRQVGVLFERVAPVGALTPSRGPIVGEEAPNLRLRTLDGEVVQTGGRSTSGRRRLLMFVSSQCPICKVLIPTALDFARDERLDVIFAGDAPEEEQRRLIDEQGLGDFPFINSAELGRALGVDKLPHAALIDEDGRLAARGLVNSREHLESLVVSQENGLVSVQQFLGERRRRAEQGEG